MPIAFTLRLAVCVAFSLVGLFHTGAEPVASAAGQSTLRIVGSSENDLVHALTRGGKPPRRFDSARVAIEDAPARSVVLVLADAEAVLPDGGALAEFSRQHLPADFFPEFHVGSHSSCLSATGDEIGADSPIFPNRRTASMCATIFDRRDTRPPPPLSTAVNK